MPGASRSIEINAPAEKCLKVITAYDTYPEFLPEAKSVKVLKREGAVSTVEFVVNVVKDIRYKLRMTEEPPSRMSWTFIEGEMMKDNKGNWTLEDLGGGRTKATYTVEMALGALVPKTIVNALVETSLPKMLDAFKKRIESAK